MATLMEDYEGAGILGVESLKKGAAMPQSRKEKLKAELQLLEWHKMANNAAIKGALLQTKSLRQQSADSRQNPTDLKEDAKWIKSVIQQEQLKPLEVSKDFVLDYEKREKANAEHLSSQVDRHISTLKSLRVRLEARQDLKQRSEEYRQWQRDFLPKKQAVMIGKTLAEIETLSPSRGRKSQAEREEEEIDDKLMQKVANKGTVKQELSTVLDSLSRLAELEQRISSLERENRYDELKARESPTADQRSPVEFRKRRTDQQGPRGIAYELKGVGNRERNFKVSFPSGGGASAVRAMRRAEEGDGGEGEYDEEYESDVGNGVFITAQTSTEALRDAARKERERSKALAPPGTKALRGRVQAKRSRMKEQTLGQKKHEAALKEMARRKNEPKKRVFVNNRGAAAPARGAASGVRSKNKHLQDFQNMKAGFQKRKEGLFNKPVKREGGVESRLVSQTAPAYSQPHPAARAPVKKIGTAPMVRVAIGGMTRKVGGVPTGRGAANAPPMPPIAVTGMGGLRLLKQQKQQAAGAGRR